MKNNLSPKQWQIAETMFQNAERLSYGSVAVELKIHENRIVGVTHTLTENIRHREAEEKK